MNILFLSTRSPYPLISGHSLRTYHILKGAAEEHNVHLLTFCQHEHEFNQDNVDHLKSFCKSVYQYSVPADISKIKLMKTLTLNLFSDLPLVAQKYDSPEMRKQIRTIIQNEDIDIVHVDMLPLTCYINEFLNHPKILVNHNVESLRLYRWYKTEKNPARKLYLGLQYRKLKRYEINAMKLYNACVVVSETDKVILKQMGIESKIHVVPNGTDTSFFVPDERKIQLNSVVWMGHMDVHTNRDAVMFLWEDIFPLLVKKIPEIQMTFVGTSPPEAISEAARNDSRVKVTGFVDDIRDWVQTAAVFVVPIRIGSGTRLKILDALSMKKAIVSTSVGCEGLDVTDGENILIADTPEDFSEKVVTLIKDEKLRSNIEDNARKLAFKYDWQHQCRIQKQVYDLVLKQ